MQPESSGSPGRRREIQYGKDVGRRNEVITELMELIING
jgi:hypothetical protein